VRREGHHADRNARCPRRRAPWAARLAELAVPNELLVTRDVAAEAHTGRFRFEPAGKRLPKGFDAPVTLLTLERP